MDNKNKQVSECAQEKEIRAQLIEANYGGRWAQVYTLTTALNQHAKTCPVCNGSIYSALFGGVKVEVVE